MVSDFEHWVDARCPKMGTSDQFEVLDLGHRRRQDHDHATRVLGIFRGDHRGTDGIPAVFCLAALRLEVR